LSADCILYPTLRTLYGVFFKVAFGNYIFASVFILFSGIILWETNRIITKNGK